MIMLKYFYMNYNFKMVLKLELFFHLVSGNLKKALKYEIKKKLVNKFFLIKVVNKV
jgi:hypothetical protein